MSDMLQVNYTKDLQFLSLHKFFSDKYKYISFQGLVACFVYHKPGAITDLNDDEIDEVFLLVRPGQFLNLESNTFLNKYKEFTLIYFSPTILGNLRLRYSNMKVRPCEAGYLYGEVNQYIKSLHHSIEELQTIAPEIQKKILFQKIEVLGIYLIEKYGQHMFDFMFVDVNNNTLEFKDLMENNIMSNMTLKELAIAANMSISKFKRIFNEVFGEPPISWFRTKKLEKAKELLEDQTLKVGDISELVGYQNPSNFSKIFREHYGQTPNEFRKVTM